MLANPTTCDSPYGEVATVRRRETSAYSEPSVVGSRVEQDPSEKFCLVAPGMTDVGRETGEPGTDPWAELSIQIPSGVAESAAKDEPALLEERDQLFRKKLTGTASPADLRRLEMVHWYLDRIEASQSSRGMLDLAKVVELHERFARNVSECVEALERHRGRGTKR